MAFPLMTFPSMIFSFMTHNKLHETAGVDPLPHELQLTEPRQTAVHDTKTCRKANEEQNKNTLWAERANMTHGNWHKLCANTHDIGTGIALL